MRSEAVKKQSQKTAAWGTWNLRTSTFPEKKAFGFKQNKQASKNTPKNPNQPNKKAALVELKNSWTRTGMRRS